jgi:hypothetical protein
LLRLVKEFQPTLKAAYIADRNGAARHGLCYPVNGFDTRFAKHSTKPQIDNLLLAR